MISNKNFKGYHYILDFKNVPFDICNNKDHLENIFNNIIKLFKLSISLTIFLYCSYPNMYFNFIS